MKLLVRSLQEIARAECAPLRLGEKCDVRGRQLIGGRQLDQGIGEPATHCVGSRAGTGEQARACHRSERYRDLEFGIVVATGAFEGFGPPMVEDVLALRMGLRVTGCCAEEGAANVFGQQVARLPAGAAAYASGIFQ